MSLAPVIVITGTDTEVGKTHLSVALAMALTTQGKRVIAIKPVESGFDEAHLEASDGARLARATHQAQPRSALTRLRAPLAPPVAADQEGVTLDPDAWLDQIAAARQAADLVLVEGAGGLLSPLTWEITALDLIEALDAQALVIAPNRLGVINHTRLTLTALAMVEARTLGVILNDVRAEDASTSSNLAALRRVCPDIPALRVGHAPEPARLIDALAPALAWFA